MVAIKLGLSENGLAPAFYRRIKVDSLNQTGISLLKRQAVLLFQGKENGDVAAVDLDGFAVTLFYVDGDGDKVLIATRQDLLEAIEENGHVRAAIKVHATVTVPASTKSTQTFGAAETGNVVDAFSDLIQSVAVTAQAGVQAAATQAKQAHREQQGLQSKKVHKAQMHLAKQVSKEQFKAVKRQSKENYKAMKASASSSKEALQKTMHAAAQPKTVVETDRSQETKEATPFIHGRHTCDLCLTSPIIGKRFHATNLPDYDMCGTCHDNYKGNDITFQEAVLDRDICMQERWARQTKMRAVTRTPIAPPAQKTEIKEPEEEVPYIHGRHTCDLCLTSPIIGKRFHATNRPDYDICGACHENYKGNDMAFVEMVLDRDSSMQDRWARKYQRMIQINSGRREGRCIPRCSDAGPDAPSGPPPPVTHTHGSLQPLVLGPYMNPETSWNAALAEAVRRSLEDENKTKEAPEEKPAVSHSATSDGSVAEALGNVATGAPEENLVSRSHTETSDDSVAAALSNVTAEASEEQLSSRSDTETPDVLPAFEVAAPSLTEGAETTQKEKVAADQGETQVREESNVEETEVSDQQEEPQVEDSVEEVPVKEEEVAVKETSQEESAGGETPDEAVGETTEETVEGVSEVVIDVKASEKEETHQPSDSFSSDALDSGSVDAFEDAGADKGAQSEDKVHVRVQQRSGRKCITTVAGLADDLDIKRICKAFKKNFSCNGAVQNDEEAGEVIQLSGDQRTNVKSFLVDQEICHHESIVLHGF